MRVIVAGALALLVLGSSLITSAQNPIDVQGELNRGKAAFHGRRFDEAITRFERLARAGNPAAQFYLGQMAATGAGMPKDFTKAAQWYGESARQGYTDGQAALGSLYLRGLGVGQSYPEAARWSRLAADQGHAGAAYNLAVIYRSGGPGVPADRAEAEKWARIASSKGFPDAMKVTTRARERSSEAVAIFGEGRQRYDAGDMTGAAALFRRCADMGDPRCQIQIGWQYENGKGVARSDAEAVRWYRAAADQDDADAQVNLGNMYQAGRGVTKSCKTAVEWYARAALQNDHHALYSLGRMYQFGFGVKEDRSKAHAFYRQSAAFGNVRAREALATFDGRTVWPDEKSRNIYLARVERWSLAIQGCQAEANIQKRTVTCLVPVIDWNPKTWAACS